MPEQHIIWVAARMQEGISSPLDFAYMTQGPETVGGQNVRSSDNVCGNARHCIVWSGDATSKRQPFACLDPHSPLVHAGVNIDCFREQALACHSWLPGGREEQQPIAFQVGRDGAAMESDLNRNPNDMI